MSLPEPLDLISLQFGQPSSPVRGMSQPSQTDQKTVYPREGDILKKNWKHLFSPLPGTSN